MDNQLKRQLVVEQLRATAGSGKSEAQVALDCGVGLRTVKLIKSKLRPGSSLEEVPRSGRPRTVRTYGKVEAVAQSTKDHPRQSIRGLAKGFGCAEYTMRNLVHKDLGMKSIAHHQHHPEEAYGGTWREAHFWRKEMWPPQSPDLNPLD